MILTVPNFLIYIASWLALVASVWIIFEGIEGVASEDIKTKVKLWLNNVPKHKNPFNWAYTFSNLFDYVFTKRHLSLTCFIRSCIASTLASFIVFLLWGAFRYNEFQPFIGRVHSEHSPVIAFFILLFIFNFLPDYISLLETRWVLKLMSKISSLKTIVSLIILDAFLTALISFLCIGTLMLTVVRISGKEMILFFKAGLELKSMEPRGLTPGLYIYASFVTSIWIYIYLIGGIMLRLLARFRLGIGKLLRFCNVDKHPIGSIGMVASCLITIAYITIPTLRLLSLIILPILKKLF